MNEARDPRIDPRAGDQLRLGHCTVHVRKRATRYVEYELFPIRTVYADFLAAWQGKMKDAEVLDAAEQGKYEDK